MSYLGPSLNTNGLVLYLDGQSPRCYDSAENYVLQSENFFTANWIPGGYTTANVGYAVSSGNTSLYSAPDGTATAQLLTDSLTVQPEGIFWDSTGWAITPSSSIVYTVSAHVKKNTSNIMELYNYFAGIGTRGSVLSYNFDNDTVTVGGSDGGGTVPFNAGRQLLSNGWVRVYYSITDALGTNNSMFVRIFPAARTASFTGSTLVWGLSVTSSSYVKAYTRTTSTSILRNSSNCNNLALATSATLTSAVGFSSSLGFTFAETSTSVITVPFNASAHRFDTGQTLILWLKPKPAVNQRRNPYAQAYAGGGTITQETTVSSGFYYTYYWGTDGTDGVRYTGWNSPFVVNTSETAQICITRDAAQVTWFKNGRTQHPGPISGFSTTSNPFTITTSVVTGTNPITIGYGYTGYNFIGDIYQVLVYDRGLTSSEVLQNFATFRGRYGI